MNDLLLCLRDQLLKTLMTALHGELMTGGSRYFLVLIIPSYWKFQFWLVTTLVKMFGVKKLSPLDFQMSLHRMGEDIFFNHTETL